MNAVSNETEGASRGGMTWRRIAAEIAAVVFGILIAFAIDAEWERRQEIEWEQEILASLETDLQSSLDGLRSHWLPMHAGAMSATLEVLLTALELDVQSEMDGLSPFFGSLVDSAFVADSSGLAVASYAAFLARVADRRGADPGAVTVSDSLIGAALVTSTYDPTTTSLTALLTQGGLSRIGDPELRGMLSALPAQLADAADEERSARDHVDRRLRPLFEAGGDMTVVNMVKWGWLEPGFGPNPGTSVTVRFRTELLGALALRVPQQLAVVAELSRIAGALEQTVERIREQRR
jgi:hypothetical protein